MYLARSALALALALAPGSALAGAGAIEINHARALAGGVTGADTPGYPVTIDASGSYVLTGNLTQPGSGTDVIEITGDDVVLDLGGFAITGATLCSTSCTPTGIGRGVYASGSRTVVRNGSVRGLAANGMRLAGAGGGFRVENVIASHNGGTGIEAGFESVIERASALSNGAEGLRIMTGVIADSLSAQNLGVGVSVDSPATVARTVVRNNTSNGIYVESGGRVAIRDCQIESNGDDGVDTLGGFLSGNRISGHGATFFAIRNRSNPALQLDGNVLVGNNGSDASPQIVTTGPIVQLGANVCGSDTTCP